MNTFGRNFRISIFGESHGSIIGVTIDGCKPGIDIFEEDFANDLKRRKPGAIGTTSRIEDDKPIFISGVFNNKTTGAPLTIIFENNNTKSSDYEFIKNTPRPGHADFVLNKKYFGYNDYRGGGHSSGRLTVCLVAAGVVAKKLLNNIGIHSNIIEAGGIVDIEKAIENAIIDQDSIGGIISCSVKGLPIGIGEPFFNSLESQISQLVFSIPAIKGIEFGIGFDAAKMKGSEHNDSIIDNVGITKTNNAGGINGGISNGNEILFKVAVKPTSSTPKEQHTWNFETNCIEPLTVKGRHDLCIALRIPVIIEAVTAIAIADLMG